MLQTKIKVSRTFSKERRGSRGKISANKIRYFGYYTKKRNRYRHKACQFDLSNKINAVRQVSLEINNKQNIRV